MSATTISRNAIEISMQSKLAQHVELLLYSRLTFVLDDLSHRLVRCCDEQGVSRTIQWAIAAALSKCAVSFNPDQLKRAIHHVGLCDGLTAASQVRCSSFARKCTRCHGVRVGVEHPPFLDRFSLSRTSADRLRRRLRESILGAGLRTPQRLFRHRELFLIMLYAAMCVDFRR